MANKEELYVSISPQLYRTNKSSMLRGQADLLETLKRLHNLKVLEKQKNDLKKILHRLFASLAVDVNSIQNKMPKPKIPKMMEKPKEPSVKAKVKDSFPEQSGIEDELRSIQEKLRELNS
jgi:hypothetical protein